MKLVYVNIKKFKNIINQEWKLDSGFDISFTGESGNLNIVVSNKQKICHSDISTNSRLDAVHVLVGKTGSGKTNLLQLVGITEELRTEECEPDEAYFLLYVKPGYRTFILEIFNVEISMINNVPVPEGILADRETENFPGEISAKLSAYIKVRENKHCISFVINDSGSAEQFVKNVNPDKWNTFIFNGFDRNAFTDCPYLDEHGLSNDNSDDWLPRIPAPYHRTDLLFAAHILKEYIDTFSENSVKKKAALVIKWHNWSEKLKQHLNEALEESDYWTFWKRKHDDEIDIALGKKKKKADKVSVKNQFVHDLWTDYAIYLRQWINYIDSFEDEIPEENLDASGQYDVFQEYIDYAYEKEYGAGIDPAMLPDFEKMSIVKRLDWLAQYIDRKSDGDPHGLIWQTVSDIKDIGNILNQLDDKYFTNDEFVIPIEDIFTEKNKILMEDLFERMGQYQPDDIGIFTSDLLPYRFSCISSGEFQYAKVLGGIEEYCYKLKVDGKNPNVIYLLDEPETYMHPELCRCFLSSLDRFLQARESDANIQIIISTHSPMMLSDLMSGQITRLDVDEDGYCHIKESEKLYFSANIHTILADGFFLDYTIGEHARTYLEMCIARIKEMEEKLSLSMSGLENSDREELENMLRIVACIGEKPIRDQLEKRITRLL